jgi:hypothetical protein
MKAKAKAKLSLTEIMTRNPHLDHRTVMESLKLHQELRKMKRGRATYRLASPLTQKRVTVRPSERVINLTRQGGHD